ncbi:hypothetical protein D3C86_1413090 [compost metagenome]
MVGGELVGGGVKQGVGLITRQNIVGDGRQSRHPGCAQSQGAGAAEGALFRRGGLDQGAQVGAGLVEHPGVARGQAGFQHQGGAVQPQVAFDRSLLTSQTVQGGVQQGGGLLKGGGLARNRGLTRAQAGVQGGDRRSGVAASRGGQGGQQGQDGVQPRGLAAQVKGQHPGLGQFQRGADGFIVIVGVASGVAGGGFRLVQAGRGAAATGVFAPQG